MTKRPKEILNVSRQNVSGFGELLVDLNRAEKLLNKFTGGYSDEFFSAEEFHLALVDMIIALKSEKAVDLMKLYQWFAPTGAWDDFVGEGGVKLGNKIFEQVSGLLKSRS